QVVVGPCVETENPVFDGVLRREHEHRCLNAELAQRCEDVDPVAPRQHEVEEYQVERTLAGKKESFLAGRGGRHVVVLGFETPSQGLCELLLVLDDQNAQDEPSARFRAHSIGLPSFRTAFLTQISETLKWCGVGTARMIRAVINEK